MSGEKGNKPAKPRRPRNFKPQYISNKNKPDRPQDWGCTHLGELNVVISDGPFGSNLKTSDYTESGVRVIRLENIGYGVFLGEKLSFISHEKFETIKKHSVFPGTIVLSSFVTGGIRSCIVPDSISIAINKADCFSVVLEGVETNTEFLGYFLQSRLAFKQLDGLVHGVGRPRINTTQLKELYIPICSSAEQTEVVRILDRHLESTRALEAEIDAGLAHAVMLRQSTLKKAFSGELVPQDPNDEPASVLLERIRSAKSPEKPRTKI